MPERAHAQIVVEQRKHTHKSVGCAYLCVVESVENPLNGSGGTPYSNSGGLAADVAHSAF
ncbi:MAG TPA: hypothetical protein VHA33_00155 [Candidatus Angelobacter sp.]|jgi:hypothetical protein|nr:hypothetical protein [Candidatus Angelobacter sp.]